MDENRHDYDYHEYDRPMKVTFFGVFYFWWQAAKAYLYTVIVVPIIMFSILLLYFGAVVIFRLATGQVVY